MKKIYLLILSLSLCIVSIKGKNPEHETHYQGSVMTPIELKTSLSTDLVIGENYPENEYTLFFSVSKKFTVQFNISNFAFKATSIWANITLYKTYANGTVISPALTEYQRLKLALTWTEELEPGYYKLVLGCNVTEPNNYGSPYCGTIAQVKVLSGNEEEDNESTEISGLNLSNTNNYIVTATPLQPQNSVDFSTDNLLTRIQFYDGLGRPFQTVERGITPDKKDLVYLQEYDEHGRESNTWLPAMLNNVLSPIETNSLKNSAVALNGGDTHPFSKPVYENSPLDRVVEEFGPGQEWHNNGKAVKQEFITNIAGNDSLHCLNYLSSTYGDTLVYIFHHGPYPDNELFVTRTADEENKVSFIFTDKNGNTILSRQRVNDGNSIINHDTYFIYDELGRLTAVLPPMASENMILEASWEMYNNEYNDVVRDYVYLYLYDSNSNCFAKRIPGAGWQYTIHDQSGRLILSQDELQRESDIWIHYGYDAMGRLVFTTIHENVFDWPISEHVFTEGLIISQYQGPSRELIGTTGYTTGYFHPATLVPLTVNYYDDYSFLDLLPDNIKSELSYDGNKTEYGKKHSSAKGQLTGTRTYSLDGDSFTASAIYYDNRDRVIQTRATNHMGGTDFEYLSYNFTGQPLTKLMLHTGTYEGEVYEKYDYSYDHAGRLIDTDYKLSIGSYELPSITLATNSYDNFGRLNKKTRNNSDFLVDNYSYNIRSWLSSITGPIFNEHLSYNYDGNIKTMEWEQSGITRKYNYQYDDLSRLTNADYSSTVLNENYKTSYGYDKHGNIKNLNRYGKIDDGNYGLVDELTMSYRGNQLFMVQDIAGSVEIPESNDFKTRVIEGMHYIYNKNGSLIQDKHKGITDITYNLLNLPEKITIDGEIYNYTYDAAGIKQKVQLDGSYWATAYNGNKIYDGIQYKVLFEGGYYINGLFHFYFNDHLGNVRTTGIADPYASEFTDQRTHYYPFGLAFAETSYWEQREQPYLYNGKELDRNGELNLYDYGARYYDPAIARFTTIDPMAEKYYSMSPYTYCGNNPVNSIDINGDTITIVNKGYGGNQHLGILIQNDSGKWQYFSVNGDNVFIPFTDIHSGGRKFNDLAVGEFNSPQEFLNSDYNSEGDSDDISINSYGYKDGFIIPTSAEQDKIIRDEFTRIAKEELYTLDIIGPNQCATVIQRSLNKAGIETKANRIITNRSIGESFVQKYNPYLPSQAFKTIIYNNPNGKYIKK